MNTEGIVKTLRPYRRVLVGLVYVVLIIVAYYSAYLLRFDFHLGKNEREVFWQTLPYLILIQAATFGVFRAYSYRMWRYASLRDIVEIFKVSTIGTLLFMAAATFLFKENLVGKLPRSVLVLDWVMLFLLVGGVNLAIRLVIEYQVKLTRGDNKKKTIIVGANDAGEVLIRETQRNQHLQFDIVGVVDEDATKVKSRIHGVRVMGVVDDLPRICRENQVQEIIVTVPLDEPERRRRVLGACLRSGVPFKKLPPLETLLLNKNGAVQFQDFRYEDLFDRAPALLHLDGVEKSIQGKRVMVTGAGGSIGAELCRQLARWDPERLVLYERAESSLFYILTSLRDEFPTLRVEPVVGDILNRSQLKEVIASHSPQLIYHAAAYKHVHLMESQPLEAIQNNVFGTECVALEASAGGVERFVLISTDKAVNACGVMGMTKFLAESMFQTLGKGPTTFVSVRFGNVIGSHGSVLPLFYWQLAKGGPLTVTDPGAARYFMNVSEAAQLVIYAGSVGQTGEVFYLDMGTPVKIMELANSLIRSFGLEPGEDISLEVTGLRPGERLNEELIIEGEEILSSDDHRVVRIQKPQVNDKDAFRVALSELRELVGRREQEAAISKLKAMVEGALTVGR